MAWSTTAPTLPSGSSWAQAATLSYENNNLKITGTIYVARLNGTNFAVKVTETRTFYKTGFTNVYHRCDVAGVTGTAATGTWPSNSGSTVSYYFTGVAAAGASVKVVVGRKADSTDDMITKTFNAPALLTTSLTISFNAQGGSTCSAITRNKGATYGTLPTTTRRGYKFLGWSTTTSSSNIVSSTTTITQSANFTLYAIWKFVGTIYVKVSGKWKESPALYIKVNGKWI